MSFVISKRIQTGFSANLNQMESRGSEEEEEETIISREKEEERKKREIQTTLSNFLGNIESHQIWSICVA